MMQLKFRKAVRSDVQDIVKMLSDDELGKKRETYSTPLPKQYYAAFDRIHADMNQELIVVENEGDIVGTLQLSFIPYLTYRGGIRAQIEAVRVNSKRRGQGIGEKMFHWAIDRAKERGAHLLQLTTDKKRPEALHFYEKMGFKASHEGLKMHFR